MKHQNDVKNSVPSETANLVNALSDEAVIQVAYKRRQNKTIMNCFRDRSTAAAATASASAATRFNYERQSSMIKESTDSGRPEAVVFLRELRMRPNKLALLKPPLQNQHNRNSLLIDEDAIVTPTSTPTTITIPTSSSSTSSSSGASAMTHGIVDCVRQQNLQKCSCCSACRTRWKVFKQRMQKLEQDVLAQRNHSKDLEFKLNTITKLLKEKQIEQNANVQHDHSKYKQNQQQQTQQQQRQEQQHSKDGSNSSRTVVLIQSRMKLMQWINFSNWWKNRPTIETLKKQNIYNDEPCFDTELELVLKHETHKTIPRIVIDCCDLIENKYRRSSQPIEGIYRQCGDYNKIQTLRFQIDANNYDSLNEVNINIHTLTGILKLFLREIKSPLISANEAKTFVGKPQQWLLTALPAKIEALKRLIRSLPEINRDTMDYLFAHFNRLTKVPLQQISAETLSISITPTIFHTVSRGVHMHDIHELLRESEMLADCIKIMIEYHQRIFDCISDSKRCQRLSVRNLKKTLSQPDLLFHNLF